jgi:hypothetical protein
MTKTCDEEGKSKGLPAVDLLGQKKGREVATLPRGRRESRSKRLNKNNCEFILVFEFDQES